MEFIKRLSQVGHGTERWDSQTKYILAHIAMSAGLGNWRFPYYTYDGGVVFIFLYLLIYIVFGIPLATLELALGQFTSCAVSTCWQFSRIFGGIGLCQLVMLIFLCLYHNASCSFILIYFGLSFDVSLPWNVCDKSFASEMCIDYVPVRSANSCLEEGLMPEPNGACYNTSATPKRIAGLWNYSLAMQHDIKRRLPSTEYLAFFYNKPGFTIDNLGEVQWSKLLSIFACSVIAFACGSFGLMSLIRFVNVLIYFAFAVLFVFLCISCSLEGSVEGIALMFEAKWSKLGDSEMWLKASLQVIYELGLCLGLLHSMASFNKYRGDVCQHAVIIGLTNVCISFTISFITFGFLGFLALQLDVDMREMINNSEELTFGVIPYAIGLLPRGVKHMLLIFFLAQTFILGLSTQIYLVLLTMSNSCDVFLELRHRRLGILALLNLLFFLLSIPFATEGGNMLVFLFRCYSQTFVVYLIVFLELVSIVWVYGYRRFLKDIEIMVGHEIFYPLKMPFSGYKWWLAFCWTVPCTVLAVVDLGFSSTEFQTVDGYFTSTRNKLGVFIIVAILLPFPAQLVYRLFKPHKGLQLSLPDRLKALVLPSEKWGPCLPRDRQRWINMLLAGELPLVGSSSANVHQPANSQPQVNDTAMCSLQNPTLDDPWIRNSQNDVAMSAPKSFTNVARDESALNIEMAKTMKRNRDASIGNFFPGPVPSSLSLKRTSHKDSA